VDQNGLVRGFRQGSLKVLARSGGKIGTAEFTVLPKPPVTVQVTADLRTVVPGGLATISATPLTEDEEPVRDLPISYRSSAPQVATVDAGGVVTGRAPGNATITAEIGSVRGQIAVQVVENPVSRVEVTGATTGRTGDVLRFEARAFDRSGKPVATVPVRWVATTPGATVFSDGGFVAEKPGTYVVNAIAGAVTGGASVIVTARKHDRKFEAVSSVTFPNVQIAEGWAINDVWYVSSNAGRLYTFDITDPAAPRLVDSLLVDARLVNDISTTPDGKIGVLSREGASSRKNGIVFLDLSEPLHPKVLSEYTATVSGGVHSAFIDGHYVYATDDGARALKIIDFKDPRNPREIARWQVTNSHSFTSKTAPERTDTTRVSSPAVEGATVGRYLHDVQVKDGLAYLAYFKDGAVILDVGNGIKGGSPQNPKFVARYTYNTTDFYPPDMLAGTHTVFRYKNYLVVGDEVFPQFFDTESRERIKTLGRLHILDVTDIEHPKKVAEYSVPDAGSHNVWVEDDVLYVGNFEAGVRAVDVSGELRGDLFAQGREIGAIWSASPRGYRVNLPMTWGAQPHKGFVFATDMNSGAWIGRLTPRRLTP
jgi:hypothetical protein